MIRERRTAAMIREDAPDGLCETCSQRPPVREAEDGAAICGACLHPERRARRSREFHPERGELEHPPFPERFDLRGNRIDVANSYGPGRTPPPSPEPPGRPDTLDPDSQGGSDAPPSR